MKNKKKELGLLILVLFQIFILMNMITADNYMISQSNNLGNNKIIEKRDFNKLKGVLKLGTNLVLGFISIKQIGFVSAVSDGFSLGNCCLKTKAGAICQDVSVFDRESCDNPIPTSCSETPDCQTGCCLDSNEGLCDTNAPKGDCEANGGIWDSNVDCNNLADCNKGCCLLGSEVKFITDSRCQHLSEQQGFEKDFRDIETEPECLALGATQEEGACVFEKESGNVCSFTTEAECLQKNGYFAKGYLCSYPDLNVNCEKQNYTGCVEGKDEIYWFDSCGNRENIYSSDKDFSWNDGRVLKKGDSCNPSIGNINSEDCGNCNRFSGSSCSKTKDNEVHIKDGDYTCQNLNCIDPDTSEARANGESWCVYEGYIGDGKDTVGSRQWRKYCDNGEVKTEGCDDYRGAVCAEGKLEKNDKSFSVANCVTNQAAYCLSYNSDENKEEECNKNEHCILKNIDVDEGFQFNACVPKYPKGFDLRETGLTENICSMASQKCIVLYEKDISGSWRCKQNCDCEKQEFTDKMNDFCVSLGDCGTYVNYIGDGTQNTRIVGAPQANWQDYKKYSEPVEGQFVKGQGIDTFLAQVLGIETDLSPGEISAGDLSNVNKILGKIAGASGGIIMGTSFITGTYFGLGELAVEISYGASSTQIPFGAIGGATSGFGIGLVVGSYLAKFLGLSGNGAAAMSLASGVAGGAVGYYISTYGIQGGLSNLFTLGAGAIIFWVAIAVMVYIAIVGWGKTKQVEVEFNCLPWEAPIGGDNCQVCNENSDRPCTEYKCESLGQACKLINDNQDVINPTCESLPKESIPPVISKGDIQENYKFVDVTDKKIKMVYDLRTDGCIQEWSPVLFSLKTDEVAQCRASLFSSEDYDSRQMYSIEGNAYVENHTFVFAAPSISALNNEDVSGDIKEKYGNVNMYLKCQDVFGNRNTEDYMINFCINSGPDETASFVNKFEPINESYLSYGNTKMPFTAYINEPSQCKYDYSPDKNYDEMSETMTCETGISGAGLYGWPCTTILKNLTERKNNVYIKCKDQPWLTAENDSKRNINQQDIIYVVKTTIEDLKIDSVRISVGDKIINSGETIKYGFEPVSLNIMVETSGGVNNGKSTCYYQAGTDWVQFKNTFSNSHKQTGFTRMGGNYNTKIKCEDEGMNAVETIASYTLNIDTTAPKVTRAYYETNSNSLRIITDEEAECYYNTRRCNFNVDSNDSSVVKMTSLISKEHSAPWENGEIYYIKCIDVWNNSPPNGCTIKVTPESLN